VTAVGSQGPAFRFDLVGPTLRRYAIFIILAALIVFFHFAEPAFLRVNNLFSVLQSVAVVALLAIGVTVTLAVDGTRRETRRGGGGRRRQNRGLFG
jgi:ABC-type glucose/galactose transport system permease subunit